MARLLAPAGEAGLWLCELTGNSFDERTHCTEVTAVGEAETEYLCHPFLLRSLATARLGFIAQPPLLPAQPFQLEQRDDGDYSPVEQVIEVRIAEFDT